MHVQTGTLLASSVYVFVHKDPCLIQRTSLCDVHHSLHSHSQKRSGVGREHCCDEFKSGVPERKCACVCVCVCTCACVSVCMCVCCVHVHVCVFIISCHVASSRAHTQCISFTIIHCTHTESQKLRHRKCTAVKTLYLCA